MKLLRQILVIARIEASFYARYPRMLLSAIVVALIPAIYTVIYLSSIWDPAAHTGALGVGLVNLDRGVTYREQYFNVGQEVSTRLKTQHLFGFVEFADEARARAQVREGKLAFALIVPQDFSSYAIPGTNAGAGKLVIYASEGNSYQSAGLARRFAEELGHEVNERLNERRWTLVLSNSLGSQRSLEQLKSGVKNLQTSASDLIKGASATASGADNLSAGTERLQQGVEQFTLGFKDLGGSLQTLDNRRPRGADLNRLKAGTEALSGGHSDLARGLEELQTGTQRLQEGLKLLRQEASASQLPMDPFNARVEPFALGLSDLATGLRSAGAAQQKLAEGTGQVNESVGALTTGVRAMGAGIRTMVGKLPADVQLDELTNGSRALTAGAGALSVGTRQLRDGSQHLAAGIDLLAQALPDATPAPDGSAKGLANSVQPLVEIEAAVQNNGSGFAPNIIPGALWLGAGIAAFLMHARVLPRQALHFSRLGQVVGKVLVPASLVLIQALLVLACVRYWLKIPLVHPWAFTLTLAWAALTFLIIIFALTRAFGDAGKALALLFLAVQLSSSGGIVPIELSGGVFMDINPWLPITWVVRGIKASMFGAYDGAWEQPLALVAVAGALATTMACFVGRWRFVRQSSLRPAVEF